MTANIGELFSRLPMIGLEEFISNTAQKFPYYNTYRDEDSDSYVIEVAVAGFDKQDLTISCEGGIVTLNGHKTMPDYVEKMVAMYRGIAFRSFSKEFMIGKLYEVTKVQLKNGILTIHVGKTEPTKTNTIPIEEE